MAEFGERYADLALAMAQEEKDPDRRQELTEIAEVCRRVPRFPAGTFHEALQSLFFAQIAINLESLDNGISPGRMDTYLYPFYEKDLRKGILTREKAKELIAAFSIKMSEIIPVFSRAITRFHGGMFNGQVVTVGGMDREGKDSTNELSTIFLEVMDELRMRQPNYHARVHRDAPKAYLDKVFAVLSGGCNSPALYNDDVIVETLVKHGYTPEDARNYTAVGCVEPVSQGKSLSSTDAALFNVPIMLELALNEGRRFGSRLRTGAKTLPLVRMQSMEDVKQAFETQLAFGIGRLLKDLQAVEKANTALHPTPFTSLLLDGLPGKGPAAPQPAGRPIISPASSAWGRRIRATPSMPLTGPYSGTRIDPPGTRGPAEKKPPRPGLAAYLSHLDKFGNDQEEVDRYTRYVVETFSGLLEGKRTPAAGPTPRDSIR